MRQRSDARLAKAKTLNPNDLGLDPSSGLDQNEDNKENDETPGKSIPAANRVKRDFFGRVLVNDQKCEPAKTSMRKTKIGTNGRDMRTWVSYNEGYSNAVRKPITLKELMDSM